MATIYPLDHPLAGVYSQLELPYIPDLNVPDCGRLTQRSAFWFTGILR
jgi:hypothetical protein